MKKNYLLIATIAISSAAYAQPTLEQSKVSPGSKHDLYMIAQPSATLKANAANMGANVTWDVSSATPAPAQIGTAEYLAMSATPYATQYPNATLAIKIVTTYPTTLTRYSIFQVTGNKMEEIANNQGAPSGATDFTNPRTAMVFPYTYQKSDTDTYEKSTGGGTKTCIHTYDGYGTVITNTATHNNIVRDVSNSDGDTTITWYNAATMAPVMQADNSGFLIWVQTTAGIADATKKNALFNMYPNPATNTIRIMNKERIENIEIMNMAGQVQFTTTQSLIDISSLKPGTYLLRATSDKGTATEQFVKQ